LNTELKSLQYWQSDGVAWPDLQKIGVKLFTLATSSASSERNFFSTMSFVHNKLRNSLSTETVEKLVYIKTNYPTFADCLHVSDSEGMSSSEAHDCGEEAGSSMNHVISSFFKV
jgi:hypothetical protein